MAKLETPEVSRNGVFHDFRGFFFPQSVDGWLQSNLSWNSKKWTFRGMHYQLEPFAQTKKVTVVKGEIIDYIVDIRPSSPELGAVKVYKLSEGDTLRVPAGFAHGFITLVDETLVQYLVDNSYSPNHERSILWSSIPLVKESILQIIGINENELIINEKDVVGTQNYEELINALRYLQ